MVSYKTYKEWEQKESVIKAYTVGRAIYYITENDGEYFLQYWPNKHSKIETVSLIDSFKTEEAAINGLENKLDSLSED
jgi:hypothetical protein